MKTKLWEIEEQMYPQKVLQMEKRLLHLFDLLEKRKPIIKKVLVTDLWLEELGFNIGIIAVWIINGVNPITALKSLIM